MNSFFIKLALAVSCILAIVDNNSHKAYSASVQNENQLIDYKKSSPRVIDAESQLMSRYLLSNPKVLMRLMAAVESSDELAGSSEAARPAQDDDDDESQGPVVDSGFTRNRRRISVFKNIYHQCRIQKRKEKNLCLYLANLYQNVKGFHGI